MSRTRHVGAGVPIGRLPRFDLPTAPTPTILNVIRVALDRAVMDHRATGFKPFEIEAAKAWVQSAIAKAAKEDGHVSHTSGGESVDAVRRVINDPDLYELLMNLQNGITHIGIDRWANDCIRRIDAARAALQATPPQAGKGEA